MISRSESGLVVKLEKFLTGIYEGLLAQLLDIFLLFSFLDGKVN